MAQMNKAAADESADMLSESQLSVCLDTMIANDG